MRSGEATLFLLALPRACRDKLFSRERYVEPLRFTTRGITRVTFVNAAEPVRRQCLARTPLAAFLNSLLAGVTHITDIGEGQIRLSPLMGALETPRLIDLDGPEP